MVAPERRGHCRRWLLVFLTATVTLAAGPSPASAADSDAALPVCAPADYPDAASWYATAPEISSVLTGQTQFVDSYFVASGLTHGCASQQWESLKQVCTSTGSGTSCGWVHNDWEAVPLTSVPQQIDAAGGDEQAVTVSLPQATRVEWGQCLPRGGLGTVTCPDGASNPGHSGTVLFRFRQPNGYFTGPWQASQTDDYSGFVSPGFMLQAEHGACAPTATTCRWLVKFTRDELNQPAILKDVQLLLQFNVTFTNNIGENGYVEVAVPLLVLQRGGPTPTPPAPTPTPTPQPTATPTSDADRLQLRRSSITVRKHAAKLKLSCGAATCNGKLTLRRSAKSPKSLGSKRFKLAAGERRAITLRLNARGRELLRKKHKKKVRLEALVSFADGTEQVFTLTLRG